MRHIRPRSVYDVLALISFFLVIGGGTALASYLVSSNSQIGPGTVSGHKPPTRDHSNIIGGSVNGTDLANGSVVNSKLADGSVSGAKLAGNSVTSAKILNGSITGSDLALTNVSSALQLRTAYSATECPPTCGPPTNFYTQGPWTLTGTCVNDSFGMFHAKVELSSSEDAIVAVNNGNGQRVATGNLTSIAQTDTVTGQSGDTASNSGEFNAVVASSNFSNHISGHVLAVADGGASDGGGVGFCKFAFEGLGQ